MRGLRTGCQGQLRLVAAQNTPYRAHDQGFGDDSERKLVESPSLHEVAITLVELLRDSMLVGGGGPQFHEQVRHDGFVPYRVVKQVFLAGLGVWMGDQQLAVTGVGVAAAGFSLAMMSE
jgi:hypothetical protein